MLTSHCNINKTDRINRSVLGVMLIIGVLAGMSRTFYLILGIILIIEGLVGWCSIPYLISIIKSRKENE